MKKISPEALQTWLLDASKLSPIVLDVRASWEYEQGHLKDALHFALNRLAQESPDIDKVAPIVCMCHHGMRSRQAAFLLEEQGFQDVYNLEGGIDAWSLTVDSSIERY